jgi:carbonic anhydrase
MKLRTIFIQPLSFLLPLSILCTQCQTPAIVQQTTVFTTEEQTNLTPEQALQKLKEGNERFVSDKLIHYDYPSQVERSAAKQAPYAVVLSCMDSRTSSEIVFNLGIGDIFNIRVAGNIVNTGILGSLEYACANAGAKVIVVEGHSHCGAIHAAIDGKKGGNITSLMKQIMPAINAVKTPTIAERTSKNEAFFEAVVEENVWEAINEIRTKSEVLKSMEATGKIKIVAAVYDLMTGKVQFFEGREEAKLHAGVAGVKH